MMMLISVSLSDEGLSLFNIKKMVYFEYSVPVVFDKEVSHGQNAERTQKERERL